MGVGVSWRSVRSLLSKFLCAHLAVDSRLIALIYIPILNPSRKGMWTQPCTNEVFNGARKVCKLGENRSIHNRCVRGLSQNERSWGVYTSVLRSVTRSENSVTYFMDSPLPVLVGTRARTHARTHARYDHICINNRNQ